MMGGRGSGGKDGSGGSGGSGVGAVGGRGNGGRAWERWEGVGTVWEIAPEPPKGDKLQMGGIEGCIKNNLCQSFDSFYAINFGKGYEI